MTGSKETRRERPAAPTTVSVLEHAWRPEAVVFAVALAVRLLYLGFLSTTPLFDILVGDAERYDQWARAIAGGDWMSRAEGVFYQAPLYPYLLALVFAVTGHSLWAVRVLQAALGAAACALLARAGRRAYSPAAGMVAGLGLAVWAPALFYDGLLQKSVLDGFFIALLLALSARSAVDRESPIAAGRLVALGATLGGFVLSRENALAIAAPLLAWLAVRRTGATWRTRLAAPALAIAGMAAVLLPVAARNMAVGGEFHLTTSQFGSNFYLGNNPRANGSYVPLRGARGNPQFERHDTTLLAEQAMGRTLTPQEVSDYWLGQALAWIRSEPGAFALLTARKTMLLVNDVEIADTDDLYGTADLVAPLAAFRTLARFGLLLPLAVLGALLTWRDNAATRLFVVLGACYGASVIAFLIYGRYRFPLVHLALLLAAAGVLETRARLRRGAGRALRLPAVAAAVTLPIAFLPLIAVDDQRALTPVTIGFETLYNQHDADAGERLFRRGVELSPGFAHAHLGLADALRAQRRLPEAIQSYRRAVELEPELEPAFYNLGLTAMDLGRPDDAVPFYERAIEINPERADTLTLLGNAHFAAGRFPQAIEAYRRALAIDPDNAIAHNNWGTVAARTGDVAGALERFERAIALDPRYVEAQFNRGKALQALGRGSEAAAQFRRVLELEPTHAGARQRLEQPGAAR
ncbi:MAG: tetratricopeptide repeat protein [Acidobacteriota bacterium]